MSPSPDLFLSCNKEIKYKSPILFISYLIIMRKFYGLLLLLLFASLASIFVVYTEQTKITGNYGTSHDEICEEGISFFVYLHILDFLLIAVFCIGEIRGLVEHFKKVQRQNLDTINTTGKFFIYWPSGGTGLGNRYYFSPLLPFLLSPIFQELGLKTQAKLWPKISWKTTTAKLTSCHSFFILFLISLPPFPSSSPFPVCP